MPGVMAIVERSAGGAEVMGSGPVRRAWTAKQRTVELEIVEKEIREVLVERVSRMWG